MNDLRIPPHDLIAEGQVLGAMLMGGQAISDVRDVLDAEMFYRPAHQTIYARLLAMADEQKPIDLAGTFAEFRRTGELEQVGGDDYLADLQAGIPDPSNARYYAQSVRDCATKRSLIVLAGDLQARGFDSTTTAAELIEQHQQGLFKAMMGHADPNPVVTAREAADEAYRHAEAVRRGEVPPGLMTGYGAIDEPIGGIQAGDFIVLAGDTGVGKSAFALNISWNVAQDSGHVLFASAEMGARENGGRLLASLSGVGRSHIKGGYYDEQQRAAIATAKELPALSRIHFMSKSATVGEIASKARNLAMKLNGPLALIVVDHLQLMTPDDTKASKAVQIGAMAWGLKVAAMHLGTPMLVLSQFSRAHVQANRPPALHDLKESGDIENTANAAIFLWKHPDVGQDTDGSEIIYAKIAKCRDGRITSWPDPNDPMSPGISLRFYPHLTRFETRST